MNKLIRVYEHEKLHTSENGFTRSHYNSLIAFGEQHGYKYFNIGRNSVKFKSYVGIIQVGKLIVEILPKTDKADETSESKESCHNLLLTMLERSGLVTINHQEKASQKLKKQNLLELFFLQFIKEAEELIHNGLKKQYRKEKKNRTALKGKLLFTENLRKNMVHKERFYTSAETYDRDNIYNHIIKKALKIICEVTPNKTIKSDASNLLLHIEDLKDLNITEKQLERIKYNRHTERYRIAVELARLIILQMMPDLTGGKNSVIALLFDMNRLFELFITRELQKTFKEYSVLAQKPQRYLLRKGPEDDKNFSFMMKPDITMQKNRKTISILDVKWKLLDPEDKKKGVSQSDLYQLYTYANEYECESVVLIYPKWKVGQLDKEEFIFRGCNKKITVVSVPLDDILDVKKFREFLLLNCKLPINERINS